MTSTDLILYAGTPRVSMPMTRKHPDAKGGNAFSRQLSAVSKNRKFTWMDRMEGEEEFSRKGAKMK